MEQEIWKPIRDWEGIYEVSNLGRVKSLSRTVPDGQGSMRNKRERILKPGINSSGYEHLVLMHLGRKQTALIHQLVCAAFHGPRPTPEHMALHWDDVSVNNAASNLRWGTAANNMADRIRNGYWRKSRDGRKITKLTPEDAIAIFNDRATSAVALGKRYGVSDKTIANIRNGVRWNAVTGVAPRS